MKKATATNKDETTLLLIEEINKRKQEIAKATRPNWLTNCTFSYDEFNLVNAINLHVESSIPKLISIVAHLLNKQNSFNEAATLLGISDLNFKWHGFKVDDWIEDIKTRIVKLQIKTKEDKLRKLEERLNAIISPELKAQMELEQIMKELE